MKKKDLIKKLEEMNGENVQLELCSEDGDVIYQDIDVIENCENEIFITTEELSDTVL